MRKTKKQQYLFVLVLELIKAGAGGGTMPGSGFLSLPVLLASLSVVYRCSRSLSGPDMYHSIIRFQL